ncbi:hypothetical protein ACTFIR_012843 [Dictyostelium discoideum]
MRGFERGLIFKAEVVLSYIFKRNSSTLFKRLFSSFVSNTNSLYRSSILFAELLSSLFITGTEYESVFDLIFFSKTSSSVDNPSLVANFVCFERIVKESENFSNVFTNTEYDNQKLNHNILDYETTVRFNTSTAPRIFTMLLRPVLRILISTYPSSLKDAIIPFRL